MPKPTSFNQHTGMTVAAKAAGKVRMKGKEYVMRDGDVVMFIV